MTLNSKQGCMLLRHTRSLFTEGTLHGLTDAELLKRFVDQPGEPSELAFTLLLERHAGLVLGTCRRVLRNAEDVHDAFQATFLVLARNARSIRNRQSVACWLQGVAYRVACSARSSASRRRFHEQSYARQSELRLIREEPAHGDLRAVLDRELSRLPERHRAVVVLCDLEGLSYDQAASALGWPMGTVKSRLARGREQLRARLIRRGVAPALAAAGALGLSDSALGAVPHGLSQMTVSAAVALTARRCAVSFMSPAVLALVEKGLMTLAWTKVRYSVAALMLASCLATTAILLAGPHFRAAAQDAGRGIKSAEDAGKEASVNAPRPTATTRASATSSPAAKPWESAVRIRVLTDGSVRIASGTVIHSTPEESLVLTCAHTFKVDGAVPSPGYPWKIMVDLFDGTLHGENFDEVRFVNTTEGQPVDFDFSLDLGLIRIRTGRALPASPMVPRSWQPKAGMRMLSIGCSDGNAATLWNTTITRPVSSGLAGNPSYAAIECRRAPKPGRTGGGLFTADGNLAGICNFAEPRGDAGLYAAPSSIYQFLFRNGWESLYHDGASDTDKADPRRSGTHNQPGNPPPTAASEIEILRDRIARAQNESIRLRNEALKLTDQLYSLISAAQTGGTARAPEQITAAEKSATPARPRDSDYHPPSSGGPKPGAANAGRRKPFLRALGLVFAASPMGSKVVVHDPVTRKDDSFALGATKENPLEVSFVEAMPVVGLNIKGAKIARTAVYDQRTGAWIPLELSEPVSGELKSSTESDGTVTYDAGRYHYTYSSRTGKWDRFDHGTITDAQE